MLTETAAGLTLVPFIAAQMRTADDSAVGPSGSLVHVADVEVVDDEDFAHSSTCVFDADAAAAAAAVAAAAAHPVSYLQQDDSSACSGDSSMIFSSGPCGSASVSAATHGGDPSKACSARGPSDAGTAFQQLSARTAHMPTPGHPSHRHAHAQAGRTVAIVPASALQPAATAPVAEAESSSPFNAVLRASRGTSCVLPAAPHPLSSLSPQASHASCTHSLTSSRRSLRDQNSVTIKVRCVLLGQVACGWVGRLRGWPARDRKGGELRT